MVFMMDSWWNPSVEYQAMDRIHRLGQKRPVKVVKLVVEDSIEDQVSEQYIRNERLDVTASFVRALTPDRPTSAQETSHDRSGPFIGSRCGAREADR
jgi:hypothetical protein